MIEYAKYTKRNIVRIKNINDGDFKNSIPIIVSLINTKLYRK